MDTFNNEPAAAAIIEPDGAYNGFVARDGTFHYASDYGHWQAAEALGFKDTTAAEQAGFLHLSLSDGGWVHSDRRPTDSQLNTLENMYGWAMCNNYTPRVARLVFALQNYLAENGVAIAA